jgi:Ca-activated chloride channel homolog
MLVHPVVLWLLMIPAIMGCWYVVDSLRSAKPRRCRPLAVPTLGIFGIVAAILALAGPLLRVEDEQTTHVAIIDISSAVDGDDAEGALDEARRWRAQVHTNEPFRVIALGSRAVEVFDEADRPARELIESWRERVKGGRPVGDAPERIALADAFQLAGALVRPGHRGDVIYYGTGFQTVGDAAAELSQIARRNVTFRFVPVQPQAKSPLIVARIELPPSVAVGRTFPLNVTVRTRQPTVASFRVGVVGNSIATAQSVQLAAGETTVPIPVSLQSAGLNSLDVSVLAGSSELHAAASSWAVAAQRVAVVEGREGTTAAALTQILGPAALVKKVFPEEAQRDAAVTEADLIVIGDISAAALNAAAQDRVRQRVADGGSLLFTGSARSFGAGGWSESALAALMPVKMLQELERTDPAASVVFIIDTSGSMGGPRLELAKEVVRLALARLEPHDKAGIVEFYGAKRWAAPLQSAANRLDLNRALNRLTSGGGTEIYPAVEEASYALKNVNTRTRHVIIITDGGVESAPFEPLIRRMAEEDQTVSTVTVGTDESPLMESMAGWGRGRFYRVTGRMGIPEILLHQPNAATPPPVVEHLSRMRTRDLDDVTRGIDMTALEPLNGYARVAAKPSADVLIESETGDPLMVRWQVGRGRVAVVSTLLGSEWSSTSASSGLAPLIANLCRSLYAIPSRSLSVETLVRPAGLEVSVQTTTNTPPVEPLNLTLFRASQPVRSTRLDPMMAGHWNGLFTSLPPATYEVVAETDSGIRGIAAVTIPVALVQQRFDADLEFLRTMDRIATEARNQPAEFAEPPGENYVAVAGPLIVLAMMLLLLNIYLRRRSNSQPVRVVVETKLGSAIAVLLILLAAPASRAESATAFTAKPATARSVDRFGRIANSVPAEAASPSASFGETIALASAEEVEGNVTRAAEALRVAIAKAPDVDAREGARIRLAVLLAEMGDHEAAWVIIEDGDLTTPARMVAAIYGRPDISGRPADSATTSTAERLFAGLLRGSSLLDAGKPIEARRSFDAAIALASDPRDHRFITERIIAAARAAGTLPALVDEMLAEPDESPERLLLLAPVLRELNRVDDLLALSHRLRSSPRKADQANAARVLAEVVGSAEEANRLDDAEAVCRAAYAANPTSRVSLDALVGVLLRQDRLADADALLVKAAHDADSANSALVVATAALAAGRDDAAVAAATTMDRFGGDANLRKLLFLATLEHGRGNAAAASARLDAAIALVGGDASQLQRIAEASERIGDRGRAIGLYRRIGSSGEEIEQRLAWLLTEDGDLADAQSIWASLSRSASSSSRSQDARGRMLALAARTGTIGSIAAELEERLSTGQASADDIALLVQVYAGIRDFTSAAAVLQRGRDVVGGEIEMLRQLSQLYLTGNQFGFADRALRKLLDADPDSAVETLQQIAVLAVERVRPDEARAAMEELARRTAPGASTDELNAGIFSQLGLHEDAARAYERVLAAHPKNAEAWLLWSNAMKASGLQKEAVHRLLLLALNAENDDLFSVAVDALLNLDAPREALRIARRAAIVRLCGDGRKFLRYELVRELSDALSDVSLSVHVGELSLLAGTDHRTEMLRELITVANKAGQTERTVTYQRTLLALGDQVPPQVFLEIGRRLVTDGRMEDAGRAFRRAVEASADDNTRRQVSELYERAGQLRIALRTLEPLVRQHSSNVELRVRCGGLYEQLGEWDNAIAQYAAAIELLVRQGGIAPGLEPAISFDAGVSKSVSDSERYMDTLLRGILNAARTTALQQRVAEFARSLPTFEVGSSDGSPVAVDAHEHDVARLVRRLVFPLHRPDIADAADEEILSRRPEDRSFTEVAVSERADWGLRDGAAALAMKWHVPLPMSHPQTVTVNPSTAAVTSMPDAASNALSRLIVRGETDEARRGYESLAIRRPASAAAFPMLIAVAHFFDDPTGVWRWCEVWLAEIVESGPRSPDAMAEKVAHLVRTAWTALDDESRLRLLGEVRRLAATAPPGARPELATLAVQISLSVGEDSAGRADDVLIAASGRNTQPETVALLVRASPEARRPAVIERIIRPLAPAQRRSLLLQFSATNDTDLDPVTIDVIKRLIPSKLPAKNESEAPIEVFPPRGRFAQPSLWKAIGEALVERDERSSSTEQSIASANALSSAGDEQAADSLAANAIIQLSTGTSTPKAAELKLAVRALSLEGSQRFLESLGNHETHVANSTKAVLRSILLERVGQPDAALEVLRTAFIADPRNAFVRGELTTRLRDQLRWSEMISLYEPHLADRAIVDDSVRSSLATARREAGWTESADTTVFQLYAGRSVDTGSPSERELKRFRAFHQLLRQRRQYVVYPARAPIRVGGLQEFDRIQQGQSIYQALANESWATEEYLGVLRGLPPGAPETAGVVAGLAAISDAEQRDLMAQLDVAATNASLTTADRLLLLALVRSGAKPSPQLSKELERMLADAPPTDLQQLADISAVLGESSRAQAARDWVNKVAPVLGLVVDRPDDGIRSAGSSATQPANQDVAAAPGARMDDAVEARRLARFAGTEPQRVSKAIEIERRAGSVGTFTHPLVTMVASQAAAANGDVISARRELELALETWLTRTYRRVPDLSLAMPSDKAHLSTSVSTALEVLAERAKRVPADRPDLARAACLIGRWAAKHDAADEGARCLELAKELAPNVGEHSLWAADLARILGRACEAEGIELRLLRMEMLPLVRVAPLVAGLKTTNPAEATAALSFASAQVAKASATTKPATAPSTSPTATAPVAP